MHGWVEENSIYAPAHLQLNRHRAPTSRLRQPFSRALFNEFFFLLFGERGAVDCRSVVNATRAVLLRDEWLERYGLPAKKLCGKLVLLLVENLDMKERLFNENIFTYLYGL